METNKEKKQDLDMSEKNQKRVLNYEGIDISEKIEWFQKIKGRLPDKIIKQFVEVENQKDALSNLLRGWIVVVDSGSKYLNVLGKVIEEYETGVHGEIHDLVIGRYIDDLGDLNEWRKDLKDATGIKEGDLWCEGLLRYRIEETGRAVEKLMDMLEEHYGDKILMGKIGEFFEYKEYYKKRRDMIEEMERKERDYHIRLMKGIIEWPNGPVIDGLPMKKFIPEDKSEDKSVHGYGPGTMICGILRRDGDKYSDKPIIWERKEGSSLGDTSDGAFIKVAEYGTFEEMYDDGWKVD